MLVNRLLANLINQLYVRQVVVIVLCNRAKSLRLSQRDIKWIHYSVCSLSYSQCCQIESVATGWCLPASSSCYKMSGWGFPLCTHPCEKCRIAPGLLEANQTNGPTEFQQIYQNMSDFPPVSQVRGQWWMSFLIWRLKLPPRFCVLLIHMSSSCCSHSVTQTEMNYKLIAN